MAAFLFYGLRGLLWSRSMETAPMTAVTTIAPMATFMFPATPHRGCRLINRRFVCVRDDIARGS